jgi:ribosomal protein L21E
MEKIDMDETKIPHPEPRMDTQYHLGQVVRVKAHARRLPKMAAKFAGKVGQVVNVKEQYGLVYYRVRFRDGVAVYTTNEIQAAGDVA